MKDILREFANGSSRQKLSILSDFSTILGVSVATFVAGPFLSRFANIEFVLSDFILSVLFYFLCLYLVADTLYEYVKSVSEGYKQKKYGWVAGSSVLFLFFIWVYIVSFPYAKYYVGNIFNVSYLLATPAHSAVKGVKEVELIEFTELTKISISLDMGVNVDPQDYVATLYMQNKEGLYQIVKYGSTYNADYEIQINKHGSFSMPAKLVGDELRGSYLVVYRKSDWSFLEHAGAGSFGYPSGVNQIPTNDIDNLGAFIYKIDLKKSIRKVVANSGSSA